MKTLRVAARVLLVPAAYVFALPVDVAFGQSWTQTSAPSNSWKAVAMSADGMKLAAVANNYAGDGLIYFSTNSGITWTPADAPVQSWYALASSAQGTRLLATASSGGSTYLSADSGATWRAVNVEASLSIYFNYWSSIASSADGQKLFIGFYDSVHRYGGIAGSSDSGTNWTLLTNAPAAVSVACSADGIKLLAGSGPCCGPASPVAGSFAISTNSGAAWMGTSTDSGSWNAVSSSADSRRMAAAVYGGVIYVSTNSGATWDATAAPVGNWISMASSADGTMLIAVQGGGFFIPGPTSGGPVYTSNDSGSTWMSNNIPDTFAVASSADGHKLVAAVDGGGIYVSQSTAAPPLSITRSSSNTVVSWGVPSAVFVLQQNPDLSTTNWVDVTNPPTLNFTTLRKELIVSPSTSNCFYQLNR